MKESINSRLHDLLEGLHPEISPKKAFLVSEQTYSYGQLQEQVAKTRSYIRKKPVPQGERAVIISSDKYQVSVLYISCITEGITAVILDPDASAIELSNLIERSKPAILFIDDIIVDHIKIENHALPKINIITISLQEKQKTSFSLLIRKKNALSKDGSYPGIISDEHPINDKLDISSEASALILFTSGTTSQPKGVELSRLNLETQLPILADKFNITINSKIVNHLPLHHSDGLNQGPLLAISTGATWIAPTQINMHNLGDMLDTIYRERATHLITVPTVLSMMTLLPDNYNDSLTSDEFNFIESTAGPLEQQLWKDIEKRYKTKIVNCYGLTETVNEAFYCGPDIESRKIGTIGKPAGCEVRIIDENGQDVHTGKTGELLIKGNIVMKGYFDDVNSTKEAFQGDWFKTGDLASYDKDGFYQITGRKKNIIIRAGINIQPEDITSILLQHNEISAAVTLGQKDDVFGERVICCITLKHPDCSISINDIFEHCRKYLAKEKIPNEILILKELPYGPSGKVELSKLNHIIQSNNSSINTDKLSTLEKILTISANVLHIPRDNLNMNSTQDDIEEWDSLAFLALIVAIEKEFKFKIGPKDIMNIKKLDDFYQLVIRHNKYFIEADHAQK